MRNATIITILNRTLILAILVSCLSAITQSTHAAEPTKEELKLEILQLKQENKRLKQKMLALEVQLNAAREKLANLGDTKSDKKTTDTNKPNTPTTTKPEDIKQVNAPKVTYGSTLDILQQLPDDAKPSPNSGWDTYRTKNVEKWLKERRANSLIRTKIKISRISVKRNNNANNASEAWEVMFVIEPKQHTFEGVKVTEFIQPRPLIIKGDEQFARRAQKRWGTGPLTLTGEINQIRVQAFNARSAYIHGYVSNPEIEELKSKTTK